MKQDTPLKSDIIIVGGGLVGLACALALGGTAGRGPHLSVALVDAQAADFSVLPEFDGRASALSQASKNMLEAIGAWAGVADLAQPISDIVVTDSELEDGARPSFLRFDAEDNSQWPSAYMVENRHIRQALAQQVEGVEGISFYAPCKVEKVSFTQLAGEITLGDGRVLSAPLIIAADGRNSYLRQQVGIKTVGWEYEQHGIVATIEHEMPHGGVAEEHFLPAGPFAILPLKNPNHSSLVWTEQSDIAQELMAAGEDEFDAALRLRFGTHLGSIKRIGPRWSYPLSLQLANEYAAQRLMLVGDAAHVVHPLAGLGFNLGLRDVAALVDVVEDALHLGMDYGAMDVGENYQRWRRFDNVSAAFMMDGLNRLFSNNSSMVRLIRDLGLGMVENSSVAKSFFIKEAAGLSGDLPKMMRG